MVNKRKRSSKRVTQRRVRRPKLVSKKRKVKKRMSRKHKSVRKQKGGIVTKMLDIGTHMLGETMFHKRGKIKNALKKNALPVLKTLLRVNA